MKAPVPSKEPEFPEKWERLQENPESASFKYLKPNSNVGAEAADEAVELREVLKVLRRRMWMILLCGAVGVGLAYGISRVRGPTYLAQAVIRIEDPQSNMVQGLSTLEPASSRGQTDAVLSALEVLRSQTVLGEIVDREGLQLVPPEGGIRSPDLRDVRVSPTVQRDTITLRVQPDGVTVSSHRTGRTVEGQFGTPVELGSVRFSIPDEGWGPELVFVVEERQRVIQTLERGLETRPRPETNIVDVEFTDRSPEVAQRVVNAAVEVFRNQSLEDARGESQRRRTFLEEQLAEAELTLYEAQEALSAFRSREQVFSSQERAAAQQAELVNIEIRREELRADQNVHRTLLEGLQEDNPEDLDRRIQAMAAAPEIAQNPVVATLFAQLLEYRSVRDSLTSGPWGVPQTNPDVVQLDQQLATTRERLQAAVQSHIDATDARLSALTDLRNRSAGLVATLPEAEAEEARLIQQVQSIEQTVEQLRTEFYRARISEAVQEGPVQIVDLAPLPLESQAAGLPLVLSLGLMLGLMTGSGGAFLLEMLNTSVRHQHDLEDSLQIQTIGVIPRLPGPFLTLGRKTRANRLSAQGVEQNGKGSAELITVHEARSAPAEAFRTLRTNLLFTEAAGRKVKTLVVTSAVPGEGKTITTANLAVTYAQQGLKVVAVDCDLRKPRLAEMFGMKRKPGLTEFVLGQDPGEHVVREFEAIEGLSIIPSGSLPPNPTELLGGARMRSVLGTLQRIFDVVILDTPPLAGGADAAILGAACDGVLMVVKAGETDRNAVREATRQLHTVGAHLLGAVMNDPYGEVRKYGYSYAYEYDSYGES